jgi:hypothetical protein
VLASVQRETDYTVILELAFKEPPTSVRTWRFEAPIARTVASKELFFSELEFSNTSTRCHMLEILMVYYIRNCGHA